MNKLPCHQGQAQTFSCCPWPMWHFWGEGTKMNTWAQGPIVNFHLLLTQIFKHIYVNHSIVNQHNILFCPQSTKAQTCFLIIFSLYCENKEPHFCLRTSLAHNLPILIMSLCCLCLQNHHNLQVPMSYAIANREIGLYWIRLVV